MQPMITTVLLTAAAPAAMAQTAADKHYDPQKMEKAREALHAGMGGQTSNLIMAERLEYQSNDGDELLLWDGQGWIGGDINKFWVKTEGEFQLDETRFEEVEVQALYSRAISPYFDLQAGVRHDLEPGPSRSFAVLGLQGLAPYWFEVDAALFLSDDGDLSARIEAEYEINITQRLILQPRAEFNLNAQDVPEYEIGSGLGTMDAGLRLRYEIQREFAPYIGISWSRAFGDTADFRRAAGDKAGNLSFVTGLRFWF